MEELDLIISCAASIIFSDPLLSLIKTNYYGAFRVVSFAKSCKKENVVFNHVSTAFTHSYLPKGSTIPEEIMCTDDPDTVIENITAKDPAWINKNEKSLLMG